VPIISLQKAVEANVICKLAFLIFFFYAAEGGGRHKIRKNRGNSCCHDKSCRDESVLHMLVEQSWPSV